MKFQDTVIEASKKAKQNKLLALAEGLAARGSSLLCVCSHTDLSLYLCCL